MDRIVTTMFETPVGELIIGSYQNQLCLCDWAYRKQRQSINQRLSLQLNAQFIGGCTNIHEQTKEQLTEYFSKQRKQFSIKLCLVGTAFQKEVWQQLQQVNYGSTISYLQLSKSLGNNQLVRAVANANGANAIAIIIPCHRVIGANGKLVGYAGGLAAKRRLLALEDQSFQQNLF